MNKVIVALAFALLATAIPSASGSQIEPSAMGNECKDGKCKPTKILCFNLFCRYENHGDKDQGYSKCQAGAVFTKRVTSDGDEIQDRSEVSNPVTYTVDCDGQRIFNNSGRRFTESWGTRIQALGGPYPATLLPKNSLKDVPRHVPSVLELSDQTLKGSCYVYTGQQLMEEEL